MTNIEIQIKLKILKKSQKHLALKFHRKASQISQAIQTDSYPTLKNKIIKYLQYLETNETFKNT